MILNISLSAKSISEAITKLKDYKRELPRKINALIEQMVSYGEDYAINAVGHVDTGETINSIVGYRRGSEGFIVAGGNAVWIEFGTGITYNGAVGGSPHPKGEELGMTIGTFGEGHGADPNGWYYPDSEGKWKHTYGIEANMFMYQTAQAIRDIFPKLAQEIFNSD